MAEVERVVITEIVAARGETMERERHTLRVVKPIPRRLTGLTVREMLGQLRQMVAQQMPSQVELLNFMDQLQAAPLTLDSTYIDEYGELG